MANSFYDDDASDSAWPANRNETVHSLLDKVLSASSSADLFHSTSREPLGSSSSLNKAAPNRSSRQTSSDRLALPRDVGRILLHRQTKALVTPQRRFICKGSVWEVVHVKSVKERVLFLFNDLLLVTKEVVTEEGQPPSFDIKTIISLRDADIHSRDHHTSAPRPLLLSKEPSAIQAAIAQFASHPPDAFKSLVEQHVLEARSDSVAHFLHNYPQCDPTQAAWFLGAKSNREILQSWVGLWDFEGAEQCHEALYLISRYISLEADKIDAETLDRLIDAVAIEWSRQVQSGKQPSSVQQRAVENGDATKPTEVPSSSTKTERWDHVKIFRAFHFMIYISHDQFKHPPPLKPSYTHPPSHSQPGENAVSVYRRTHDLEGILAPAEYDTLSEYTLHHPLTLFTPRQATPTGLNTIAVPYRLTVQQNSEPITVTCREGFQHVRWKVHGAGLQILPTSVLDFSESTAKQIIIRPLILGKTMLHVTPIDGVDKAGGTDATVLPYSFKITIEPTFMQNVLNIREPKGNSPRSYLFSVASEQQKQTWLAQIRACLSAPETGISVTDVPIFDTFSIPPEGCKLFPSWAKIDLQQL